MKSWWSRLISRWQKLPSFDGAGDVSLFIHIFLFAVLIPMLMRLELPRLRSLLSPRPASTPADPHKLQQIAEYVEAAIQLGRPFIRESCLTRGVTRYYFMNRAGLSVSLCFGMGQVDENFAGHCWLVNNGEPFLEKRDPRPLFKIVYSFPGSTEDTVRYDRS